MSHAHLYLSFHWAQRPNAIAVEPLDRQRGFRLGLRVNETSDRATDIDPARRDRDAMPLTGPLLAMHAGGEVNWVFVPGPTTTKPRRRGWLSPRLARAARR